MAWGGDAPWALGVMWGLTAVVFAFQFLRLYTRIMIVAGYGIDDHIYMVAAVFLLIFNIFVHMSANNGFGQTNAQIGDMELVTRATLYECIGQGFAIVGMAVAKCSLGCFLLRLVSVKWHVLSIHAAMIFVSLASVAQVLCFWLSCVPLAYVYDRRIPGGSCPVDTRPTSYILCVSTIMVDLFFAIFPWIFVWSLQMPKREKITIAASMSLGLIAAAAGMVRTAEVEGLYGPDYLKDSVGLIVWSAAEMAVTLICIGIPVCRPLLITIYRRFRPSRRTSGYLKQQEDSEHGTTGSVVALRTIGGGIINAKGEHTPANQVGGTKPGQRSGILDTVVDVEPDVEKDAGSADGRTSYSDVKLGIGGPFTTTQVGRSTERDNSSEEQILGDQIVVTETYQIERN